MWKVILNAPDEALDIFDAIGVNIGDVYSDGKPIPCVSVEGRADGESRMVRIITAQYRTSAGVGSSGGGGGGGGGGDPRATAPDLRFASFAVSTSYMEMPAWAWLEDPTADATNFVDASNPVGDMYDGITRYEPIVNFSFKQFEATQPTAKLQHVGKVNSNSGTFGSLTLFPRSTLFKACNIEQHVESWGGLTYRGFMVSYEFAYRKNRQSVMSGSEDIGWDVAVPQTGFNVFAFAPPGNVGTDVYGQPLKHSKGRVIFPNELPTDILPGDKVRAMVKVMEYTDGGASQTPSAQPVALTVDGNPKAPGTVEVYRRGQHEQFNFTTLSLRLPI